MHKEIVSEAEKFVLPFCVLSEKRDKPFTSDMELAAVFSIAELNRRKGGRFLRRAREKMKFLSKIGYPLWLFPLSHDVLLFDGLTVANYSLPYPQISNVKAFTDSLKSSSRTRETHMTFLADHVRYFEKPTSQESFLVKGLINDSKFVSEVNSYCLEAAKMEVSPANFGLLASSTDERRLQLITQEMANLRTSFEKDVKDLNSSIQFLRKTAQGFLKDLHGEMQDVKDEFGAKIKVEEAVIAPQIEELRKQYDEKTLELSKSSENQQLPLHTQKLKLEKTRIDTKGKVDEYGFQASLAGKSDDKAASEGWKQRTRDAKEELSSIEDRLKTTNRAIEDLDRKKAAEAAKLKSGMEAGIKDARKNLVELEASRDAKVLVIRQEIEKLEERTKHVSDEIGKTVKLREANIVHFEKLFAKPHAKELHRALVYVPFYVVCYSSGANKRFLILPPSVVGALGISTKLIGALGKARIKSILVPRFKKIGSLGDTIQEQNKRSSAFEAELRELGEENNILTLSSTLGETEKGLMSLKDQGWLSDADYGAIVASAKTNLNLHV